MVIVTGKQGAHVGFEVNGERVNIDEIPAREFCFRLLALATPIVLLKLNADGYT